MKTKRNHADVRCPAPGLSWIFFCCIFGTEFKKHIGGRLSSPGEQGNPPLTQGASAFYTYQDPCHRLVSTIFYDDLNIGIDIKMLCGKSRRRETTGKPARDSAVCHDTQCEVTVWHMTHLLAWEVEIFSYIRRQGRIYFFGKPKKICNLCGFDTFNTSYTQRHNYLPICHLNWWSYNSNSGQS